MTRLAAVLAAMALGASSASGQSLLREQMRAELTEELEKYVRAFSEGRVDYIADSVYTAPAYFYGSGSVQVLMTRDEVLDRFRRMWDPLPSEGYSRSDIRGSDVCVLNDSAALVTLEFARLRRDGSVMAAGTAVYFYARTEAGWRINASIGSASRIDCGGRDGLG